MEESEWKRKLTQAEFQVLRMKATEPIGSGEYNSFFPKSGAFLCRGCNAPLYPAASKFACGCGWPAFESAYKGQVKALKDMSFGTLRWEIVCRSCGGHLGHVFNGEGFTSTNERHCVNSLSIRYSKAEPSPPVETETLDPQH